jgi:hypothetical protein
MTKIIGKPMSELGFKSPDNNVNEICDEFVSRSQHGFNKYGVTTERTDLDFDQWIQHLKDELMDAVVYIHRVQKEREMQEGRNEGC